MVVTSKVSNSEPNSTQFDSVEFLNSVVILAVFIFKRSSNKPQSVDRLFFLVKGSNGMVKIVTTFVFLE